MIPGDSQFPRDPSPWHCRGNVVQPGYHAIFISQGRADVNAVGERPYCQPDRFVYNQLRKSMDTEHKITIEIKSFHRMEVELNEFPELSANHKIVRKGLDVVKRYTPAILRYLSKQRALANLGQHLIEIRSAEPIDEQRVRRLLGHWIRRKKRNRLAYVIIEALIIPFTIILVPLPGPNVAFYFLIVLFYFHFKAFLTLRKIDPAHLHLILPQEPSR
jgi:hypothetical protein